MLTLIKTNPGYCARKLFVFSNQTIN